MAVIDGNVMAINPGEDPKMQMFIWNNIFFSLGFDVRDHYKDLGGDAAAYVAPKNDLQGVKVFNAVDLEGLYTLGTVVIDYRGYRVTAQSIIPGVSLLISVFSLCHRCDYQNDDYCRETCVFGALKNKKHQSTALMQYSKYIVI